MYSTYLLKVKFETSDKIYDFPVINSETSFFEQQEKFLCSIGYEKEKKMYSLCDPSNNKFVITINEVKTLKQSDTIYPLKNCHEYSKKVVQDMYKYLNAYKDNLRRVSAINQIPSSIANELKNIVFSLQNHFQVDGFTEEFIAFDGIEKLIEILEITSGHTKVYISLT
jgi:hypothetical protein